MESGRIRSLDPECLAYCIMGIAEFMEIRWILWGREVPPDYVFECMMSFVARGMAVTTTARAEELSELQKVVK